MNPLLQHSKEKHSGKHKENFTLKSLETLKAAYLQNNFGIHLCTEPDSGLRRPPLPSKTLWEVYLLTVSLDVKMITARKRDFNDQKCA